MQGRMLVVLGVVTALLLSAPAVAVGAPKPPKDTHTVTVDNPFVFCFMPQPAERVEVDEGTRVHMQSDLLIDYVVLKSGKNATLVSSIFGIHGGVITLSKEVGWYVVWGCETGGGGDPT